MGYKNLNSEGETPIHAWTDGVPVEAAALEQVRNVARLEIVKHPVALMPDVHYGIAATIGSVIATQDAIIPAAVGVDLGCVDCETEFLTPYGWNRIDEWRPCDLVMQYDPDTGSGKFVKPTRYVREKCDEFIRIKTKYGVDQKLSPDHTVLYAQYTRDYEFKNLQTMTAGDLERGHNDSVIGFRGRFLTTFIPDLKCSLPYSDDELRILIMIAADGCIRNFKRGSVDLGFKKDRKIARARFLLSQVGIVHREHFRDGRTTMSFNVSFPPTKTLKNFFDASLAQLEVIADEVIHWDGNAEDRVYFTRDKGSADFISYCFAATGRRSVMRVDADSGDGQLDYRVFAQENTKVGISGTPKTPITREASVDGFKYCFTVPSGFWVMRRGGQIAITGNCGMRALRTSLTASELPDGLGGIRSLIEQVVPHGRSKGKKDTGSWCDGLPELVAETWAGMHDGFTRIVEKHPAVEKCRTVVHLGTLGGGNHFVELCLDEEDRVWVMLHSGSRGMGNRIGSYFIALARKEMERLDMHLPDKDLAYLTEGTEHFDDYVEAVGFAQEFAKVNRQIMMMNIIRALQTTSELPHFNVDEDVTDCHHNYVAREKHGDQHLWITRKGALNAERGRLGIIPGSMGRKSFIVRGRGNPDSYNSCSHGAGRVMSRTMARKLISPEQHAEDTRHVECRRDTAVIDESPRAYKNIEAVMAAQRDLVTIEHTLRQVVCVKG